MTMIDLLKDRVDQLASDGCEVKEIILEQEAVEELQEFIDEDEKIIGYEFTVDESVNGDGFAIAYEDDETHLGVPSPDRVSRMADNVDVTEGAENIVFGHLDLFANLRRKYVDLDEDAMERADVEYEGEKEFNYEEDNVEHMEVVRFRDRVQADMDSEKSTEDLKVELRSKLAEQAKEAIYSGSQVEPIKVNEPVPEGVDPDAEDVDWQPERIHIGDKVAVFDEMLLGNEDEERVESVEKEEENEE